LNIGGFTHLFSNILPALFFELLQKDIYAGRTGEFLELQPVSKIKEFDIA